MACPVLTFQLPSLHSTPSRFGGHTYRQGQQTAAGLDPTVEHENLCSNHQKSLISSFLIDIAKEDDGADVWSLTQIDEVLPCTSDKHDSNKSISPGAKSWQALHYSGEFEPHAPAVVLKCRRSKPNELEVTILASESFSHVENANLLHVLPRVLAQFTFSNSDDKQSAKQPHNLVITSQDGANTNNFSAVSLSSVEGIRELFEVEPSIEIVDMVDQMGQVLGMVPRSLVHLLNILHRGIGLTVSKDADFSELYVHKRTSFKRIFPSLYDMFVGGVSSAEEDAKLTAAREVAEELGLTRALDETDCGALSGPLFTCVVCTASNRCVVTVFQYTVMDPNEESISWQEEEVSWGEYVPYNIVEAAADLSIQRLVAQQEWPGQFPAIQSKWEGTKPPEEYASGEWMTWDFVPDGLLVWEAWLNWRRQSQ